MPAGLDYDPESVRAFAEAFARASAQVGEVASALGRPAATPADFGSWRRHGDDLAYFTAVLAEDLGHLATHLDAVGTRLEESTDLLVEADAGHGLTPDGPA